eukprot:CAMPEP_0196582066 /NCGR_PEP_ID=MMETSP1081-20130531/37321_1 /TAXON_ID=36882 /ORGANISM="Pyramimonas amylifera, Strain CCMP720" /LENGTH=294 /DNA_ID=CAMNT_0041902539 /DNA_START=192 /DNA_END=1076 /DNA_ORIENTATION=+
MTYCFLAWHLLSWLVVAQYREGPFPLQYAEEFSVLSSSSIAPGDVLKTPFFPPSWPYSPSVHFARDDPSPDLHFYSTPRLQQHIDPGARSAIRQYLETHLQERDAILDVCSSWVSHLPPGYAARGAKVIGIGMNKEELSQNPELSSYIAKDLNAPLLESQDSEPPIPLPSKSIDVVTCHVSIDYLVRPLEVTRDMFRVLRPGGSVLLFFSNRFFPTKVVNIWKVSNDAGRIWIAGSYLHYAGFINIEGIQLETTGRDPMYLVRGTKPKTNSALPYPKTYDSLFGDSSIQDEGLK